MPYLQKLLFYSRFGFTIIWFTAAIFFKFHSLQQIFFFVYFQQQYIFIHDCVKDLLEKKRKKEMEDENIYMNNFNNMDENIYENKAFGNYIRFQQDVGAFYSMEVFFKFPVKI